MNQHARQLEEGNILVFPKTPFEMPEEDRAFLLDCKQAAGSHHKNIAYRPMEDRVTGFAAQSPADTFRLNRALRDYSRRATEFLGGLLPGYAQGWRLDYASFRPQQEKGRQVRLRARNDLLHVDAFPTRPTNGDLILRLFTNINPVGPRCWTTSSPFPEAVASLSDEPGFPRARPLADTTFARWGRSAGRLARGVGVPLKHRSPYDQFMLAFHHFLKENANYQANCPKREWKFPPGATWIVFTDVTPHAALSGQFALEQTFIVPRASLALPERCPAAVLERLFGGRLTDPAYDRGPARRAA
jgi:hypothetical protein